MMGGSLSEASTINESLNNSFVSAPDPDSNVIGTVNLQKDPLQSCAAAKSYNVLCDKASWIKLPSSRNWKETKNGYTYYGELSLKSYYNYTGQFWMCTYSGTLTR